MKNNPQSGWPVLAVVLAAALLRLLFLDVKPPHFDEGVNGWFVDEMTRRGYYHYDPENYHGPLHFYLLFIFQTLLGRHAWALRLPAAAFSTLSVWWVAAKCGRFFNRRTCLLAALAMALSPGAVFYGRYAIHESELVFFLILAAWGLAGLRQFGERKYLWALGLGITGAILTKETYAIHAACFALAGLALAIYEKFSPSLPLPAARPQGSRSDLARVLAVCAGLILFFYSGNFLDWNSLRGLYLTYAAWIQTGAEGHGHEKPFYYWLTLLVRYEWIALAGFAGALRHLLPRAGRMMRFLAIYGTGALAAYSIVRYKTPWCVITLIWPFFFVFGALADEMASRLRGRRLPSVALAAVVAGLFLASGASAVRLNFFHCTDEEEPYVYVQTLPDIYKLTQPLFKLAASDPAAFHMPAHILLSSYYPLPWVLGDFTAVGYYSRDNSPAEMDAGFLLADEARVAEVEKKLRQSYFTAPLKLRGSQDPARLYLNFEKFRGVFPGRKPEFTPPHDESP
jgi:uncharacterized protein (TIGR03663 family)